MGRHAVEDEASTTTPLAIPGPRTGPPSGPVLRRVGLAPGEPVVPPREPGRRWRKVVLTALVLVLLAGAGAVALTTIKVPARSAPAPAAAAPAPDPLAYLTQRGNFAPYFARLDQAGLRSWRTSPRAAASAGVETCNAFAKGSDRAAQLRAWRATPDRLGVPAAQAPAFLDAVTATICPEYPDVTRRRTFSPEGLPG